MFFFFFFCFSYLPYIVAKVHVLKHAPLHYYKRCVCWTTSFGALPEQWMAAIAGMARADKRFIPVFRRCFHVEVVTDECWTAF
jgi:hypothetical protein